MSGEKAVVLNFFIENSYKQANYDNCVMFDNIYNAKSWMIRYIEKMDKDLAITYVVFRESEYGQLLDDSHIIEEYDNDTFKRKYVDKKENKMIFNNKEFITFKTTSIIEAKGRVLWTEKANEGLIHYRIRYEKEKETTDFTSAPIKGFDFSIMRAYMFIIGCFGKDKILIGYREIIDE